MVHLDPAIILLGKKAPIKILENKSNHVNVVPFNDAFTE